MLMGMGSGQSPQRDLKTFANWYLRLQFYIRYNHLHGGEILGLLAGA